MCVYNYLKIEHENTEKYIIVWWTLETTLLKIITLKLRRCKQKKCLYVFACVYMKTAKSYWSTQTFFGKAIFLKGFD